MDTLLTNDDILPSNIDPSDFTYDNDALEVLTELFESDAFPEELLNTHCSIPQKVQLQLPRAQNGYDARFAEKTVPNSRNMPESPPYSSPEPSSPGRTHSPSTSDISCNSSCGGHIQENMNLSHRQFPQPLQHPAQQLSHPDYQHLQLLRMQQVVDSIPLQAQPCLQPSLPPQYLGQENTGLPLHLAGQIPTNYSLVDTKDASQPAKKRKYPESVSDDNETQMQQKIKQEPGFTSYEFMADNSTDFSPGMLGGSYQPIKWQPFQTQAWAHLLNHSGHAVQVQTYRLDGDKGFNFSQPDKAFVCQKKNHFQITACISLTEAPSYIMTPEGPRKIDELNLHFYGVKEEAPNQIVYIDQSQSDRSKRRFNPVQLQSSPDNSWKVTVGRLHFTDTTLNNMRKRGKPNPDQRFFLLVVGLFAHCQGKEYPIVQHCSEKVIVRASNPGQFHDSESEPSKWQPGATPNSVCHSGPVGINTDSPDEALTVMGNIKVMGAIVQPSDRRVKDDITEVDTKEQLKKVQAITLYNYRYSEEFADAVGLDDHNIIETGVIAQELELVMPEAVKTTGNVTLGNGEVIENLKVVDKNRLFMESLGAVKELCNVTENLESKINYLQKFNDKLAKLKRFGSIKSTASTDTNTSRMTSISTISHVTVKKKQKPGKSTLPPASHGVCSSRFLQILIFILVFVMVCCIGVILAIFLMDKARTLAPQTSAAASSNIADQELSSSSRGSTPLHTSLTTTPSVSVANSISPGACPTSDVMLLVHPNCGPQCGSQCADLCSGVSTRPSMYFMDINDYLNLTTPSLDMNNQHSPAPPTLGKEITVYIGDSVTASSNEVIKYENVEEIPWRSNDNLPRELKEQSRGTHGTADSASNLKRLRRRRSFVTNDPMKQFDIYLTSPVRYNLAKENCLDCDKSCAPQEGNQNPCSNFTYAIQIPNSKFPAHSMLGSITVEASTGSGELRVQQCIDQWTAPEPELCSINDHSPITPDDFAKPLPAMFNVDLGLYKRSSVRLRIAAASLSAKGLCDKPLTSEILQLQVWFIRVCDPCGQSLTDLKHQFL